MEKQKRTGNYSLDEIIEQQELEQRERRRIHRRDPIQQAILSLIMVNMKRGCLQIFADDTQPDLHGILSNAIENVKSQVVEVCNNLDRRR